APGASKAVTLHVPARQLSYWSDAKQQWVLDAAGRTVSVGDADATANLPLQATLKAATNNITCANEQLNTTTVNGNLTAPTGAWCVSVQIDVNGSPQLQHSTGVRLSGVTVTGNVEAINSRGASDAMSSGFNVICNRKIGGNLHIQNSASEAPWQLGTCGPNTI